MHTVEVDELGVGSGDESSRSSKSSSFEGFGFLLDPMIFSAAAIVIYMYITVIFKDLLL